MSAAVTLRDVLAAHLAQQPERSFLVAPETGRELSYRELDRQARILARWLPRPVWGRASMWASTCTTAIRRRYFSLAR